MSEYKALNTELKKNVKYCTRPQGGMVELLSMVESAYNQ